MQTSRRSGITKRSASVFALSWRSSCSLVLLAALAGFDRDQHERFLGTGDEGVRHVARNRQEDARAQRFLALPEYCCPLSRDHVDELVAILMSVRWHRLVDLHQRGGPAGGARERRGSPGRPPDVVLLDEGRHVEDDGL